MAVAIEEHPPSIPIYPKSNHVIHVHEINWATTQVARAGIIPIYDDGINKWIGLGINKFSGNITTIGGKFESTDHDLLETAIREYNEEVGPNMKNVTNESVANCYAIQSTYSIAIFHPVPQMPSDDFIPTDELFDLIWVTPNQLRIMATKQDFVLNQNFKTKFGKKSKKFCKRDSVDLEFQTTEISLIKKTISYSGSPPDTRQHAFSENAGRTFTKSTTRAFLFSTDLKLLANTIVWTVESGIPFLCPRYEAPLPRPKRMVPMARPRMCYEMSTFIEDCLQQSNWGNVSLVMTTSHLVLMRFDGNIYVLPLVLIDQIVIYLNRLTIKIYVSLKDDLSKSLLQASGLRPKSISSIEYGFSRLQNTETMAQEFFTGISTIRRNPAAEITPDLIAELNLILNYESKIYKVVEEQGGFFNEKRAYFLKGLSKINRILAQNFEGMPYVKLKNLLWNSCILPDTVMMISGDEFSARNQLGGPTFMGSNKRHFVASTNPYFIYHIVINIMIITGLLKQTRRNTSIYI